MKIMQFQITGKVVESTGGMPIANLKVEAWDKDIKYNDLLGQTFTDADGQFDLSFDSTYFREHSPDAKPDLLFKVYLGKRLLKIVDDKVYTNAGERTEVTLRIFMPEMMPEGKDRISMAKALDISAFLQKSDFNGLLGQVKETVNTQFKFVTDMFKNSLSDFDFAPIKVGENQKGNIVGKDVEAASSYLQNQHVTVNEVKKYEPKLNRKSLSEITRAPMNLKQGQKIDLYEENGKVKYYSVVKESGGSTENGKTEKSEVIKLQEELDMTRRVAADKDEKISKLEMEMDLLKKEQLEIRSLLKSDAVIRLLNQANESEAVKVTKKRPPKNQ